MLASGTSPLFQTTDTGTSTLTIGNNNATGGTFNGVILDGPTAADALTKIGTGTQALVGNSNYSGVTTISGGIIAISNANALGTTAGNTTIAAISGGTLSLANPNGNNQASTVTIGASGSLQLSFAGSDTVDKLFIAGIQRPSGTYGHSSTLADNGGPGVGMFDGRFAVGTGTLTVTSNPPAGGSYSDWQTANSTAQTINLDHDNDGVSNGAEYFLGGNTLTTGFTPLPGVANTVGTLSVTWTKAASYTGTYGAGFVVETSATLAGAWTTETSGVNVTFPSANEVIYTFPAGTKNFARLRVTGP